MVKKIISYLLVVLLIIPINALALAQNSDELKIVSQNTKYYKTIEYIENDSLLYSNKKPLVETIEITKEEFDNSEDIMKPNQSTIINTSYKRMTSTILKNGNGYRYSNEVFWKKTPATRSYDIIAIGFNKNVKVKSNVSFKLEYTNASGNIVTSTTNYLQTFTTGVGTVFELPSGDVTNITVTLSFDVEKNTTETLYAQDIYGDYAHATSEISLTDAKKFTVNDAGIILNGTSNYYDEISTANVTYIGTW